jgi:hypothetical protein
VPQGSDTLKLGLHANLVTDAWIASAVEPHAEHLVSFDRDFIRLLPVRDLHLVEVGELRRDERCEYASERVTRNIRA